MKRILCLVIGLLLVLLLFPILAWYGLDLECIFGCEKLLQTIVNFNIFVFAVVVPLTGIILIISFFGWNINIYDE